MINFQAKKAFLTSSAIFRLINPEENINEDVMIYTAVAAIIFNIILGGILLYSGSAHMHSHGKKLNFSSSKIFDIKFIGLANRFSLLSLSKIRPQME